MTRFDATQSLAGLARFQRATVEHVHQRFYEDPHPTRRFLVADETGLGKSMVAKGVIAKTIQHLQDDPTVDRIDIVYVCSNADLARQNIRRLDVTGDSHDIATRLTLLAQSAHQLNGDPVAAGKPVNLIAFTPGTLPGQAWQTGTAAERALLHVLLESGVGPFDKSQTTASLLLLRGTVGSVKTMRYWVDRVHAATPDGLEPTIAKDFLKRARSAGLVREYRRHIEAIGGSRKHLPFEVADQAPGLIGRLRTTLAHASVAALEPDLLILDEFQRFRDLIDPASTTEAADLARALFNFGNARVLLLSATPIKAFTNAADSDDDHHRDLKTLLEFLTSESGEAGQITAALAEHRTCAVKGLPAGDARGQVEALLTRYLSRTERPRVGDDGALEEIQDPVGSVPADELAGWVGLHRLATAVDAPISLDYWKSAPYFANFLDGYKLAGQVREHARSGRLAGALTHVQTIDAAAVAKREPIPPASARLRALAAITVDQGLHDLLWAPPSLPYHQLEGPYRGITPATCTKHLLFSSWAATPTSIAALLSYEADRRLGAAPTETTRLEYRTENDRPGAMTTLALFWPNPGLAALCDPLILAAEDPGKTHSIDDLQRRAITAVTHLVPRTRRTAATTAEAAIWQLAIVAGGGPPEALSDVTEVASLLAAQAADDEHTDAPTRLRLHVELALRTIDQREPIVEAPADIESTLAALGMHAPGNIAWRALGRLLGSDHTVTPHGHWKAAASLGSGFRSLFNRSEAIGILGRLSHDLPYWRAVLHYAACGDLQSVMDEHLHHLAAAEGLTAPFDDDKLTKLADAARGPLTLRPSPLSAFDPHHHKDRIRFTSRFAMRYGSRAGDADAARLPEVRAAFNSPFWPWVLTTTSVGQEGIDFHWWCHATIHWNTPTNPVDFEQREGRVNRFDGLIVRRNLAARHRQAILDAGAVDPWRTAYDLGVDEQPTLGEMAPHWVYPGPARLQRRILPFALSHDITRYRQLKDDLALYRLTFGQPRQEDLLAVLQSLGVQHDPLRSDELRLRLLPPAWINA